MLDWNISARIANIHRRQQRFEPLNLASVEVERLRSLVAAIPEGGEILGAFGAAEPETRRTLRVADVERYNQRTDIASVYLSQVPEYLLHLLSGGESGGLILESAPDEVPFASDALRAWFMVSYAALLKAVTLHREQANSRSDRVDRYRFWLERELKVLAGREAWIGFKLLGVKGDQVGKAERLLKIGGKSDPRDAVWGATWDLMYTRIPSMMAAPPFIGNWRLPIAFVTDDTALVDALGGSRDPFVTNNAHGVVIAGESHGPDASPRRRAADCPVVHAPREGQGADQESWAYRECDEARGAPSGFTRTTARSREMTGTWLRRSPAGTFALDYILTTTE